jgi:hypothetical protein
MYNAKPKCRGDGVKMRGGSLLTPVIINGHENTIAPHFSPVDCDIDTRKLENHPIVITNTK